MVISSEKQGAYPPGQNYRPGTKSKYGAPQPPLSSMNNKILWWLLRYPLQRVEDIVLALQVSANTVYRHLIQLIEEGLIEYVTPSLSVKTTCRLYYLTNQGILAVATQEQANAGALARMWSADEKGLLQLLPRLSALINLQDLVNGLVTHAPATLTHDKGYRANLAWHWLRDYQHSFLSEDRTLCLQADAALLFYRKATYQIIQGANKDDYYCALLFIDSGPTGYNDHLLITQKLEALLRYRNSAEWNQSPELFPPVIVLVPTARQRELWQRSAAEVTASLHVDPLKGAIVNISPQEITDTIWTLPWQKLSVSAPCRLRDIFTPLPRNALLPGLLKPRSIKDIAHATSPTKKECILRGDFTRRAKKVNPTSRNNHDQDEDIALLRLCLSQRHLDVLDLLYAHPLLETKEMAILLNLQAASVTRYLYELRRYCCIERYASGQGRGWYVSPRGLRLIAATHNVSLRHIAEQSRNDSEKTIVQHGLKQLKARLSHTAGIYTFFTALHSSACAMGNDHELQWWETGSHCEHSFLDHGNRYLLRPDAAFVYRAGKIRLLAWLEWEEGTQRSQTLAAKLKTYAHFVRTREWRAAGYSTLPILLIVVPEQHHYQHVVQAVTEHLSDTGMLVRITTVKNIVERSPLAAIWTQILPVPPGTGTSRSAKRSLLDLGS